MQLSWQISLGRARPGVLRRWRAEAGPQAAAAERAGLDTLWVTSDGEGPARIAAPVEALWRLAEETRRIGLGAAIEVGGEAELALAAHELALLTATGRRLRLAVTLRGELAGAEAGGAAIEGLGAAIGRAAWAGRREAGGPDPRRVALVASAPGAATLAGEARAGLVLPDSGGRGQRAIAAYRHAGGGRAGHLALRCELALLASAPGGAHAGNPIHARGPLQLAAGLIVRQMATGCDELILSAAAGTSPDRTIELLGREILPRMQPGAEVNDERWGDR